MNPRIDDLIALAALGELSDQEQRELDAAAAADPVVAAELADALASAAALQSAAAEAPPPGLKMSVMDAIAGLPQDPPMPTTGAVGTDVAGSPPASRPPDDLPSARPIGSAPSRRRFTPWLAVAAAVVVVVGAVVVATTGDGGDDGRSAEIAAVLEADDAQPHSVAGEIGELEFVYSPSQEAFVLVADSLELPPDDATYQVWLVREDGQSSLGTFEPDEDGDMEMRAEGIDPTGATIGITLEPEGGSEQPSEPMVAESVV